MNIFSSTQFHAIHSFVSNRYVLESLGFLYCCPVPQDNKCMCFLVWRFKKQKRQNCYPHLYKSCESPDIPYHFLSNKLPKRTGGQSRWHRKYALDDNIDRSRSHVYGQRLFPWSFTIPIHLSSVEYISTIMLNWGSRYTQVSTMQCHQVRYTLLFCYFRLISHSIIYHN